MKEFTIGEVARHAGIQTSAIRYYESVGLLLPAKRINKHRRYDESVLKRLGLIQLLRQAGFGIRELQVLFTDLNMDTPASTQWQTLAAEKIAEMDALIKRTQATKAWLGAALQRQCNGVDDCVTITFDQSEKGMNFTLSCEVSKSSQASEAKKLMKLMTMPLLSEA